jgi:hypothetical protein
MFRRGGVTLSGRIEARAGLVALTLVIACVSVLPLRTATAHAEACPNEQLRLKEGYARALPDCRAYEQVSPVEKNLTDAAGEPGLVQASLTGEQVSYFSILPFPSERSGLDAANYLGSRAGEGWSTQGLQPPLSVKSTALLYGLTEDLSKAFLQVSGTVLAPGGTPEGFDAYLRDNGTGSYRLVAPGPLRNGSNYAGATPDGSHILFESRERLLPAATPGVTNLYAWDPGKAAGEQLSLADVLPDGTVPAQGSVAGPGGPAIESGSLPGGATTKFYTDRAISTDGSRVFFTDLGTGQIYVRKNGLSTLELSASQGIGPKPEYWRAATPDGRFAFFTSEAKLTNGATASPEHADLYRFDVDHAELIDLSTQASAGAAVLGTVGVSTDGSYVYFVATSVLAAGGNAGSPNLYEWHNGTILYIATLDQSGDVGDWLARIEPGANSGDKFKSSRVTPDGTRVLFGSRARLTSYDNASLRELYRYDATRPVSPGNPRCVSCNPSGAAATSRASLADGPTKEFGLPVLPPARRVTLTRNLSSDGSRVFFESEEALVPQDKNGQMDVYEWEQEGAGLCSSASASFSQQAGGCLYLISTGRASSPSYFGDASPDGRDVFFFTRQSLVPQDQDNNGDIYDARIGGGLATQNVTPPPSCTAEECRGASSTPPAFGPPASAIFSGSGNLPPSASTPAPHSSASPAQRARETLARDLRACRRKHGRQRRTCESHARSKYAHNSRHAHHAARRHHS